MKVAALLIIALSHDGYWVGGLERAQTITVSWTIEQPFPAAEVAWSLVVGDAVLARGVSDMPADSSASLVVALEPPKVRARTSAQWKFDLRKRDGTGSVTHGSVPIELFPDNLFDGLAARVGERRLSVLDTGGAIAKRLDAAGVRYTRLRDMAALRVARADLVLVAPGDVSAKDVAERAALDQAGNGAGVFFFEQASPRQLAGYLLADRKPDDELTWRVDHPLFRGLTAADLQTFVRARPVKALQLPADEPALELAYWPGEVRPERPTAPRPIDGIVVTKTTPGGGRLVFCQLPLPDVATDPRAQVLLVNAIDYLLTRPEPTPSPSQRGDVPRAVVAPVPTITISPGDR